MTLTRYPAQVTTDQHLQEVAAAARRTICSHAKDVPEAIELMCMLGVYPGQDLEDTLLGPGALPTRPMNR